MIKLLNHVTHLIVTGNIINWSMYMCVCIFYIYIYIYTYTYTYTHTLKHFKCLHTCSWYTFFSHSTILTVFQLILKVACGQQKLL